MRKVKVLCYFARITLFFIKENFVNYGTQRKALDGHTFVSMDIKQIVGDNIRFIRQKRNLTQEELARDANISRTYLGEVERAKKAITIDPLVRIAKVLDVESRALVIPEYYKKIE